MWKAMCLRVRTLGGSYTGYNSSIKAKTCNFSLVRERRLAGSGGPRAGRPQVRALESCSDRSVDSLTASVGAAPRVYLTF